MMNSLIYHLHFWLAFSPIIPPRACVRNYSYPIPNVLSLLLRADCVLCVPPLDQTLLSFVCLSHRKSFGCTLSLSLAPSMLPSRPRIFRPATFHCSVTGCSRVFKSEPALKHHQTVVHVIPDALRPPRTQHERRQESIDVQWPDGLGGSLPQDETRLRADGSYLNDGLYTETHPILDGEYKSS